MSAAPVRLILVRHGRTAWNAQKRFQGQANPPLDALGRRQALDVGEEMAGALAPAAATFVLTSDLRRAAQTAAAIGARCRTRPVATAELREIALGTWEGMLEAEAAQRFPLEHAAWRAGADVRRGGGETRAEAGARVGGALVRALAPLPAGSVVVAVSHGLALQAGVDVLAQRGVVELAEPFPHLGNGQWITLTVPTGAPQLKGWAA